MKNYVYWNDLKRELLIYSEFSNKSFQKLELSIKDYKIMENELNKSKPSPLLASALKKSPRSLTPDMKRLVIKYTEQKIKDMEKIQNYSNDIWYSVHIFLDSAAMISKILWSSSEKISNERAWMRKLVKINEDSPLSSRTLRNHFEHFDERLSLWSKKSHPKTFIDRWLFNPDLDKEDTTIKTTAHRYLDINSLEISYLGKSFELRPLYNDITRLTNACQIHASSKELSDVKNSNSVEFDKFLESIDKVYLKYPTPETMRAYLSRYK